MKKNGKKTCQFKKKQYLCTRIQTKTGAMTLGYGVMVHCRFWSCLSWFESGYPNIEEGAASWEVAPFFSLL